MDENKIQPMWLMDWFGQLIEQPVEGGYLIRRSFTAGEYPDTFVLGTWPLKTPARVMFRHASSIAAGLPDAEFVDSGGFLVSLEDQDSGFYFSVNPRNQSTHWNATEKSAWETFVPLTKEMMDGFSILLDRSYGEVKSGGETVPPLSWPNVAHNIGNIAWLGEFSFSISGNVKNLAKIGRAKQGETTELSLISPYGDAMKIEVVRSDAEL